MNFFERLAFLFSKEKNSLMFLTVCSSKLDDNVCVCVWIILVHTHNV